MIRKIKSKLLSDSTGDTGAGGAAPEVETIGHTYFFVTGHPRSGTNWVSSLMNLHPDAFCDGEFHFLILRWAMDGYTSLPWYVGGREPYKTIAERNFHRLIRETLQQRCLDRKWATNPTALGDHTPRLFRVMIPPPEGRYIIVQRDGRDVLVSYTFHLLNHKAIDVPPEPLKEMFRQQMSTLDGSQEALRKAGLAMLNHEPWVKYYAAFWADYIAHDKRIYGTVSDRWSKYIKFVRYETLRADVEVGRRELYAHVGLDPERARPVSAESHTAPGFGGRENLKSFYRRGEVGDWRNYFTRPMAEWFHAGAGEALVDLGYERDAGWISGIDGPRTPVSVVDMKTVGVGGAAGT